MARRFTWKGFLLRLAAALVLVFVTYNPEGGSYFHWALQDGVRDPQSLTVLKVFAGVVLLIAWVMFIRATYYSLGVVGTVLAAAFFGTLLWLVVDYGLVPRDSTRAVSYLILIGLAGVLGAGMSWSHVRRRLSGQLDVDDVD